MLYRQYKYCIQVLYTEYFVSSSKIKTGKIIACLIKIKTGSSTSTVEYGKVCGSTVLYLY